MKKNNASLEKKPKNHSNSNFFKKSKEISLEIWHDHDLWISALAVKGGATAIIIGAVTALSYAVTLPFILPIIAVTLCGGLIGVGIYGITIGTTKTWNSLKDIYKKVIKKEDPNIPNSPLNKIEKKPSKKINKNSFFNKLLKKPLVQKILNSHIVKTVKNISDKQSKFFLAGMAGTGSAFWLASSAITLITQVVLLPVIAVSTLVTLSTVVPATIMLSAAYGLYISAEPFFKVFKRKKEIKRKKANRRNSMNLKNNKITKPQVKTDNKHENKKIEPIKRIYNKNSLNQNNPEVTKPKKLKTSLGTKPKI